MMVSISRELLLPHLLTTLPTLPVANGNYAPYRGYQSVEIGVTDPVFRQRLTTRDIVLGRSEADDRAAGTLWIDTVWHGKAHTWGKAAWAMNEWKRISGGKPFLIKGVQSAADALQAADIGCDGVVVSNHGELSYFLHIAPLPLLSALS